MRVRPRGGLLRRRHREIERADRISRGLLIFALVRGCGWLLLIVCVALGLAGVSGFHWAASLGGLVVFITLISLYANAEGEFAQAAGYWAALRAGKAHAQGLRNEQVGATGADEVLERIENLTETIHDHQLREKP